jgi:predicted RNase H-like HicB family nuclease
MRSTKQGGLAMEYPVIVERKNGVYRALIPALADLSAEGQSPDEAVQNVQQAAEAYLAQIEFRIIHVASPARPLSRYSTAQDWLEAVQVFDDDDEALREHFAEIEMERQREAANGQDAE